MKTFEINENGVVINPNEITFVSQGLSCKIKTGMIENKWYYGVDYNGINEGFGGPVTKDKNICETEIDAVARAREYLISRITDNGLLKTLEGEKQLTFGDIT